MRNQYRIGQSKVQGNLDQVAPHVVVQVKVANSLGKLSVIAVQRIGLGEYLRMPQIECQAYSRQAHIPRSQEAGMLA